MGTRSGLRSANRWLLGVVGCLVVGLVASGIGLWAGTRAAAAPVDSARLPVILAPAQTCLAGDNFDDDSLNGWTAQNASVFELRSGGPPGSRAYLHAKDGSGASTISAPAPYLGDWIARTGGCGTFCYSVNLFNDGEPGSPGIAANFYLYSGGTIAQFLAYPISEPGGPNPGWHRVCAPIRVADGNALPSSADGQWRVNGETSGAAAVAAWNTIVRNITAVRFPIDWGSSSQNEEVGYDNACLSATACPTPPPTSGPPATITGVIRTQRGCNDDPSAVAYRQSETVPIRLRIEGASQATVRVMYRWPDGGQERQIDGGTINGATDYLVSPPLVIPADAALGGRVVSLQVQEANQSYREIARCGFDVTAGGTPEPTNTPTPTPTPTNLPPPPTPRWPNGHPPAVPVHNLPQEPNLNPAVSCQVAQNAPGIRLVPDPCCGCDRAFAAARPCPPYCGRPITILPDRSDLNLVAAPDEPRHIPRGPWHLPYHAWGSGATVNAHSGELVVEEVDLEVAGRGIDFTVRRRYRSGITYSGPFGRNWEADINPRLVEISSAMAPGYGAALGLALAGGDVLRMDGTGRVDVYKRQPDGTYARPDGFYTGLRRAPDGSYSERDRSGSLATYAAPVADGIATLASVTDRHGNALRFTYDAGRITPTTIIDTLGRTITVEHDAANRITAVVDFAGRRWSYAYDEHGDLVSATSPPVTGTAHGNDFPLGKTTRYGYLHEGVGPLMQHNMIAITAPNEVASGGSARVRIRYDADDRVVALASGGTNAGGVPAGGEVTYAYRAVEPVGPPDANSVLSETTVVDANGNQRTYRFNRAGNIVALRTATNRDIRPSDPAEFVTAYQYSPEGQLLRTVLPEGNAIAYTYDGANPDPLQRGNLRALTREPDANRGGDQALLATTYAYEPIFNRVHTVTDPRGNDPAYAPPNGGAHSAARYTTTYIYDYQEGDNAALLAAALGLAEADVRALLAAAGVPMNLGDVNGDGRTDMVAGNLVRIDWPTANLPADSQLAADFGPQQPSFDLYGYNDRGQLRFAMDAEGNLTRYEYHPENDPDGDGADPIAGAGTEPLGYLKAVVTDAGENVPPVAVTPRGPVRATPGLPPYATATPRAAEASGIYLPVGYKAAGVSGLAALDGQPNRPPVRQASRGLPGGVAAAAPGFLVSLQRGLAAAAPGRAVTLPRTSPNSNAMSPLQAAAEPTPPAWRNLGGPRAFQNARTEYRYDRVGHVTSILSPRGVRTDYSVNALGQVIEARQAADVQAALNNPLEPNWPACRDLTLSECARGMVAFGFRTRYTYDANDNVVKVERENREANDPALAGAWLTTSYGYDILDQVVTQEAAVEPGRTVRWLHRYDRSGNRVLTLSPLAQSVAGAAAAQQDHLISTVYDERDGVATTSRGGVTEQFRALAAHADIPALAALPGGASRSTTTSRYDGNGNRVSSTDAVDNSGDGQPETTLMLYDGFDRPVSTVDGLGSQSFVQYDPAGNAVRTSTYGPVGGASPSGNGAATFAQPLQSANFTQPLLARSETRFDERGRAYERRDNLFAYDGATYQRPPVLVENPDDVPGDGWVITRIEYDRKSRPVYTVDDGGNRTHSRYDGLDRTVFARDAVGNEVEAVFDQGGNVVRSTQTEVTRAAEVAAGSVPSLRQRFTTVRVYDALDRLIRETDDLGQTRRWRYDSSGNPVEETDALHSTASGALIADPLGVVPASASGASAGTAARINRPGNATLSYHDGLGRMVKRVFQMRTGGQGGSALDTANPANPDGLITLVTTWDDAGRVVAQTDDTGQTTRTAYDGLDRAVRQTLADGSVYEASYDLDGHLVRTSDPNGNVVTITVDGLGRQIALNGAPGPGVDGATRQTWQYDGLSRARLTVDENDVANGADDISASLAYDSLGRTLEEVQNDRAVSSRWSGDGDRLALIYPDGRTLAYIHDGLGHIDTIFDVPAEGDPTLLADYDRVGQGRLLERRLANGVAWTQLSDDGSVADGYDAAGRMVRSRHVARGGGGATLVAGFGYGYSRDDAPLFENKLHDPANGELYPHDSLGRMVDYRRGRLNAAGDAVTAPSPTALERQTWQLDGAGNWTETSRSVAGATERELREHSPIHAVTKAGAATLVYDANGNLTDDGTRLFVWDAFNRLRRVVRKADGAEIALYAYDAFGRRAGKIVSNSGPLDGVFRTYLDGWQEIEERDVSGRVRRQSVYGAELDEPLAMDIDRDGDGSVTGATDQRLYLLQNAQLSVFALTDATGKPVEGYQYDPYGRPIVYTPGPNGTLDWGGDDVVTPGGASAVGNPFLYTGRVWEPETGLYYYRARYMSPTLGRFISQDPLGAWGTPNLGSAFAYVANMPQLATDPMGLATTVKSSKSNSSEKVMAGKGIPNITVGIVKPPGSTPQAMSGIVVGFSNIKSQAMGGITNGLSNIKSQAMGGITNGLSNIKSQAMGSAVGSGIVAHSKFSLSNRGGGANPLSAGGPSPVGPCPPVGPLPPRISIEEEGISTKMVGPRGSAETPVPMGPIDGYGSGCWTETRYVIVGYSEVGPIVQIQLVQVCPKSTL